MSSQEQYACRFLEKIGLLDSRLDGYNKVYYRRAYTYNKLCKDSKILLPDDVIRIKRFLNEKRSIGATAVISVDYISYKLKIPNTDLEAALPTLLSEDERSILLRDYEGVSSNSDYILQDKNNTSDIAPFNFDVLLKKIPNGASSLKNYCEIIKEVKKLDGIITSGAVYRNFTKRHYYDIGTENIEAALIFLEKEGFLKMESLTSYTKIPKEFSDYEDLRNYVAEVKSTKLTIPSKHQDIYNVMPNLKDRGISLEQFSASMGIIDALDDDFTWGDVARKFRYYFERTDIDEDAGEYLLRSLKEVGYLLKSRKTYRKTPKNKYTKLHSLLYMAKKQKDQY